MKLKENWKIDKTDKINKINKIEKYTKEELNQPPETICKIDINDKVDIT